MNTIPEHSAIGKPSATQHAARRGFRVPFGLRDGRVLAPTEVPSGKACGCVCPACHRPLVAKAQASPRRRPHFAHMVDLGCDTGTETGIHLRAKQVICDQMTVLLPGWHGELLRWPNPPRLSDSAGNWHEGQRVDHPEKPTVLLEAEAERACGDYRPDVYAVDEAGVVLIEIRVTYAVDEAKTAYVCRDGLRMIEIDLSRMDRDISHDATAFDQLVLQEPGNRTWISCPAAEAAWEVSRSALQAHVESINRQLEDEKRQREREAQRKQEAARSQAADKAGRQAFMRRKLRMPHQDALAALPGLVDPHRVSTLQSELAEIARERLDQLRQELPPALDRACMAPQTADWIYGVAPPLWRILVLRRFVQNRQPGDRFNNRDVFRWIKQTFPIDRELYGLFIAQYGSRRSAREAGYHKRMIDCWAFTPEENALIPNFYTPANDFTERLAYLGVLKRIPHELGGYEVAAPPGHGMYPVAAVGQG